MAAEDDDHVRENAGVLEGGEFSMCYDPMNAKLITYSTSREEARVQMRSALDRFLIRSVSRNLSFLSAFRVHPHFVEGNLSTNMLGLLVSLAVKEGDAVKAGGELAVLEAMKMANTPHAERDAVVVTTMEFE